MPGIKDGGSTDVPSDVLALGNSLKKAEVT